MPIIANKTAIITGKVPTFINAVPKIPYLESQPSPPSLPKTSE